MEKYNFKTSSEMWVFVILTILFFSFNLNSTYAVDSKLLSSESIEFLVPQVESFGIDLYGNTCYGQDIEFEVILLDVSEGIDVDSLSYEWEVNGAILEDQDENTLTIQANNSGSISVRVRIVFEDGTKSEFSNSVNFNVLGKCLSDNPPFVRIIEPKENFLGDICLNQNVKIVADSLDPDGDDATIYEWEINDEVIEEDSSTLIIENTEYGLYLVRVRAIDSDGNPSEFSGYIVYNVVACEDPEVEEPMDPDDTTEPEILGELKVELEAVPLKGRVPLTVSLDTAVGGAEGEVSYLWDFGTGDTVTTLIRSIDAVFDTPGIYTVTVTVTDSRGVTGSDSVSIEVLKKKSIRPNFDDEDVIDQRARSNLHWSDFKVNEIHGVLPGSNVNILLGLRNEGFDIDKMNGFLSVPELGIAHKFGMSSLEENENGGLVVSLPIPANAQPGEYVVRADIVAFSEGVGQIHRIKYRTIKVVSE